MAPSTFRFAESDRATARTAYETLEPFHILCYFNPGLRQAQTDTGLDGHAFYVGARAAPLGECPDGVVAATFFNFNPELIARAWQASVTVGLETISARRYRMLDDVLREILGDAVSGSEIGDLATRYEEIAAGLPFEGRALSAAWAQSSKPEEPHLRLWRAIAVIREWRGDGHIAALVTSGLTRLEAVVLHEARHPDPQVRRRTLGKRISQLTRGWSDEQWDAAAAELAERDLVERGDDGETMTTAGAALYADLEAVTDDAAAAAWAAVPDGADLIGATRPYVKAVIDAGVLPGTKRK